MRLPLAQPTILLIICATLDVCSAQQAMIVDHGCTHLGAIPQAWVDSARTSLHIGYGHTSHGSQITSGMDALETYFADGRLDWGHDGNAGELHLFEGDGYGDGWLAILRRRLRRRAKQAAVESW